MTVDLATFKAAIGIGSSDTSSDVNLQRALDAAMAWMVAYCNRPFTAIGTSQARTFDVNDAYIADVGPDLATVTELAIDPRGDGSFSTVVPSTQYQLLPFDVGRPGVLGGYQQIRLRYYNASYLLLPGRQVRVTGTWGWPANQSSQVDQAQILVANRYFLRPSAPFGVVESPQMGTFTRLPTQDPDVRGLLEPLRLSRDWVLV